MTHYVNEKASASIACVTTNRLGRAARKRRRRQRHFSLLNAGVLAEAENVEHTTVKQAKQLPTRL